VTVDPDNTVLSETNRTNNETVVTVLVATEQVFLPIVTKSD
jgi:hypothetical protein